MVQSVYRFHIGAIPAMVIADRIDPLTEERVRSVFSQDADRMVAAFHALPGGQQNAYNVLYLETDGQRVLFDTGIGALEVSRDPNRTGQLIPTLRAEGIAPESITTVILTHFHGDHIGGLLDQAGQRAFPNARVVTSATEYNYWLSAETLATLDAGRAQLFQQTFAAYPPELVAADAEVLPGICLTPAPGHTPGQSAVLIESQGDRLLHIADTIHTFMQLNAPDAVPKFDSQPDVAIATRRATFARAEREHLRLLAYHLDFPGLGTIERKGDQLVWVSAT